MWVIGISGYHPDEQAHKDEIIHQLRQILPHLTGTLAHLNLDYVWLSFGSSETTETVLDMRHSENEPAPPPEATPEEDVATPTGEDNPPP